MDIKIPNLKLASQREKQQRIFVLKRRVSIAPGEKGRAKLIITSRAVNSKLLWRRKTSLAGYAAEFKFTKTRLPYGLTGVEDHLFVSMLKRHNHLPSQIQSPSRLK